MKKLVMALTALAVVLSFGISEAVQTRLVIRAKSKDAKFIGTKMGGALVVVKDSKTGDVLSQGLTEGGTGDTGKIMVEPKTRFGSLTDDYTARFEASIDIDEPRLITISVEAPYLHKDNMIRSTTQMWLIPGKDIVGEGIIIEVPGFSVDADAPEQVERVNNGAVIPLLAHVVMI